MRLLLKLKAGNLQRPLYTEQGFSLKKKKEKEKKRNIHMYPQCSLWVRINTDKVNKLFKMLFFNDLNIKCFPYNTHTLYFILI